MVCDDHDSIDWYLACNPVYLNLKSVFGDCFFFSLFLFSGGGFANYFGKAGQSKVDYQYQAESINQYCPLLLGHARLPDFGRRRIKKVKR